MEILAPAGSRESLEAAVACGADAVYLGGNAFNARAFAQGVGSLRDAVHYAHLHGVDVHFTLNTAVLDREISDLIVQAEEAAQAGVDAFIVADLGTFQILRELYPTIPLHASTQLSIRSVQNARAYSDLGFSRLVLAREVPAEEVAKIHETAEAEIEVFCHGALCVCASGRCLMSSLLGGRSANRGACAQPCRLEYTLDGQNGHFLNTKDLSLADEIEVLRACGVTSLKIEGRMKGPLYVAAAVRAFREAADTGSVSSGAMEALLLTFSRGGFTKGPFMDDTDRFYRAHPGHTGIPLGRVTEIRGAWIRVATNERLAPGDTVSAAGSDRRAFRVEEVRETPSGLSFRTEPGADIRTGERLLKKSAAHVTQMLEHAIRKGPAPIPVDFFFSASADRPMILIALLEDGSSVKVTGPVAEAARMRETAADDIRQQLERTGGTPFRVRAAEIQVARGLAIPKSILNDLRRRVLAALENCIADRYPNRYAGSLPPAAGMRKFRRPRLLACSVFTREQAEACRDVADILYLPRPFEGFPDAWMRLAGIASTKETAAVTQAGRPLLTGVLLPDMQGVCTDTSFNVTNSRAAAFLKALGAARVTLSEELNTAQIRDLVLPENLQTEVIAYGYQTLMVTENCPVVCDRKKCRLRERPQTLTDRTGKIFPLLHDGGDGCRVRILNALPLYAADIIKEISCDVIRLEFTHESPEECARTAGVYHDALHGGAAAKPDTEFTRGHLRRGLQEG